MKSWFKNLGPGILVSAAFIGPGTVTVCTLAGVEFGYSLLWALLLSVVACIVLQEMAARLGLVTQRGLSEAVRQEIKSPVPRILALILIFAAIVIGNAAYEAGNISGAVLGISAVFPSYSFDLGMAKIDLWSVLLGALALVVLAFGNFRILEKFFIILISIMSICFLATAILVGPDLRALLEGLFVPDTDAAGLFTVMALIGTTVVPYNLFLHASLVGQKWNNTKALSTARKELFWAIILGGIVSMSILITAASSGVTDIVTAADLAVGLEPVLGRYATWFIAIGLFAAGISSSITAPLAAAYVVSGCLGWKKDLSSLKFKLIWSLVLLLGIIFASLGIQPVEVIRLAQVANGILLPVVAIFLFWIVNRKSVMGKFKNNLVQNIFGILIIGISIFLGARSVYVVFQEL